MENGRYCLLEISLANIHFAVFVIMMGMRDAGEQVLCLHDIVV
jgi:hypothetical protein